MDKEIIKAAQLEAEGKHKEALMAYEKIAIENLNIDDRLYLKRSIAACKFYLKDYENAEKEFIKILQENKINDDEKEDIEDCLYLCCLYGNKIEQAERYFKNKIKVYETNYERNLWDYWYLGQIYYRKKDYLKAETMYKNALHSAQITDNVKVKFFLAHVIGIEIILKKYDTAWENIKNNDKYEDRSSGLYKIVLGILKKHSPLKNNDWEKIYNEGIQEAKKEKFKENMELGKILLDLGV